MKKIIIAACLLLVTAISFAQSGTNSPYSQFGMGLLNDQSTGFNRAMSGLGYGFHEHNQVNVKNPASYSALDSLTFILDAAVGLQVTNFNENGNKKNAKNADIEYAVAAFRLARRLGLSFGVLPYSNVGYNYSNTSNVNAFQNTQGTNATYTNTYSGDGGVHEVFLGMGWEPIRHFSIGFNAGYIWGDINRTVINSYSDSYVNTLSKYYKTRVKGYRLNFGAQYTQPIGKKDEVTLGVVYEPGHKTSSDPLCYIVSSNSQLSVNDTATYSIKKGISLPDVIGAGLMWNHAGQLRLGFDYKLEKWGSISTPELVTNNGSTSFQMVGGEMKDRSRYTFGGEFCKGERSMRFLNRAHYRAGVSYSPSYQKINGMDGPKELTASLGFGIPIINNYNNRSMLNITGQWINRSASNFIKENTFMITIGLTFNERWFAKFKVQ